MSLDDKINTIFLDYDDQTFAEMSDGAFGMTCDMIEYCGEQLNIPIKEIYTRASSSGRCHYKVVIEPQPVVWTLIFRARCLDDPCRLAADIRRFMTTGDTSGCNRIFSTKIDLNTGEVKKAGKWFLLREC